MPVSDFPLWLASIQPAKIKGEGRQAISIEHVTAASIYEKMRFQTSAAIGANAH
jgi:hypothetical protein